MSIVTEDYCACGKRFDEENDDCVFKYHKKKENQTKHNRKCPKCTCTVVGCIFEDVTPGYDKDGYYWDGTGVCCSQCDWELELRSANS